MAGHLTLLTRRDTIRLGQAIAGAVCAGDLVVLEGPLGAGKTFLTRALLRSLGVPQSEHVTSPTFSLVHEYDLKHVVLHADLYRLEKPNDVEQLGLRERRDSGAIVLAEWAERFFNQLGNEGLIVRIKLENDHRIVEFDARGSRGTALLADVLTRLQPTKSE